MRQPGAEQNRGGALGTCLELFAEAGELSLGRYPTGHLPFNPFLPELQRERPQR